MQMKDEKSSQKEKQKKTRKQMKNQSQCQWSTAHQALCKSDKKKFLGNLSCKKPKEMCIKGHFIPQSKPTFIDRP